MATQIMKDLNISIARITRDERVFAICIQEGAYKDMIADFRKKTGSLKNVGIRMNGATLGLIV